MGNRGSKVNFQAQDNWKHPFSVGITLLPSQMQQFSYIKLQGKLQSTSKKRQLGLSGLGRKQHTEQQLGIYT